MKLYYDKKSKNPTYFMQRGIRNGSKTTTKNFRVIGKHNDLLKITDDPVAYAKEYVKKFNEDLVNQKVDLTISINLNEKLVNSASNVISKSTAQNIGYLYLKDIYDKLELKKFFQEATKDSKIDYDPNTINLFLTSLSLLHPGSKLDNFNHANFLFGKYDIAYHDIIRFLDILADNYDSYIEHLFVKSNKIIKRKTSVCYFDCTNFYFEKEKEDEDMIDEVTGEVIKGLGKYGISKEHRPNPIVQMGLFMDADGIPLSMCINPGNSNESICAVPAEKKLIDMFKDKEIVYCADAGLGYIDTRIYNSIGNRKFIVTQSIKKLSAVLQEAVVDDCDYKSLKDNSVVSLIDYQTYKIDKSKEEDIAKYNTIIYKVLDVDKAGDLGLYETKIFDNGKTKKVKSKATLSQKVIITYSRKTAEYQKKIREKQIDRAKELIKYGNLDELKTNQNDYKRFIKKENKDKATYIINQAKIDAEAKFDGFYAIATNIFDEPIQTILKVNSYRYKIEDCFRVMKTNFEGRPIYHYKDKRIKAHFLTCFTALLIYRLLETKINNDTNQHFTACQIIETLTNMNIANVDNAYYQSIYTASYCLSKLEEVFKLGLDKKRYLAKDLNKLSKK